MSTNIVFNTHPQKSPSRYLINPYKYMNGDTLTVYKLRIKQSGGMMFEHMHVIKLTGSVFKDLRTGMRFRLKQMAANKHHTLNVMGNYEKSKPLYIYEVQEVDCILTLGEEKEFVR